VKGIPIFKVLSRTWIPLVILAVMVVGGFMVLRVHGYFGSEKRESYADSNLQNPKPFNPKRITYEVFGPPGTVADLSYFDVNADPQRVDGALLPWSLHITTDKAAWVIGQVGTTIGLGLMFDTLIVRAFMMPYIAALLGRWFWWPMRVRSRPPRPAAAPAQPQPDRSLAYSD
jgi:hypothetical protein